MLNEKECKKKLSNLTEIIYNDKFLAMLNNSIKEKKRTDLVEMINDDLKCFEELIEEHFKMLDKQEKIKQRQQMGVYNAKRNGVTFGRPRKKVPENFEVMKHKWLNKQLTSRQAARELDISQSTFLKWVQESEK